MVQLTIPAMVRRLHFEIDELQSRLPFANRNDMVLGKLDKAIERRKRAIKYLEVTYPVPKITYQQLQRMFNIGYLQ